VSYEWIGDVIPASDLPLLHLPWVRERRRQRTVSPFLLPFDPRRAVRAARSYVRCIEGAISGMRGHDRTFRVACVLAIKFGLSFTEAWPIFCEWNTQCEPPWTDEELRHKLHDAMKLIARGKDPPQRMARGPP
jgi:hypothetical protein